MRLPSIWFPLCAVSLLIASLPVTSGAQGRVIASCAPRELAPPRPVPQPGPRPQP
jgi:hypothetical protein